MTKVYLDLCAIQRPLDTPNHLRIVLEAEAVLGIFSLHDMGRIELVSSEALLYEAEQNPAIIRREHAYAVLGRAKMVLAVDDFVKQKASEFTQYGLGPLDAVHVALAEVGDVDYFCTCDDRLAQRARRIAGLRVKAVSPLELIQEIEG